MIQVFQMFNLHVAFVLSGCCNASVLETCWKSLFKMFHLFLDVCCKHFVLYVACLSHKCFYVASCMYFIWILHMLKWLYMYVANVCFRCISCFRHILQVFYLSVSHVVVVIHISQHPDVFCSIYFMFVFLLAGEISEPKQRWSCVRGWSPRACAVAIGAQLYERSNKQGACTPHVHACSSRGVPQHARSRCQRCPHA